VEEEDVDVGEKMQKQHTKLNCNIEELHQTDAAPFLLY
jgi:hypothetical protein